MSRTVKSGVVTGKVPGDGGDELLRGEIAGDGEHRDDHEEAADEHGDAERVLYQCVLALRPAKAEPLLPVAEV